MFDIEVGEDERILPGSGIIVLWKLAKYCGIFGAFAPKDSESKNTTMEFIRNIVIKFQEHNIPIIKFSDDERYWIVRLEDIKSL